MQRSGRNGRPVFDIVPHQARRGLRLEAIDVFKERHGITSIVPFIAEDFDDPLPQDFLLFPLPSVTIDQALVSHVVGVKLDR